MDTKNAIVEEQGFTDEEVEETTASTEPGQVIDRCRGLFGWVISTGSIS